MKLSRLSRLLGACIALISMLSMQLAVAGYACPGMKPMPAQAAATRIGMHQHGMAGCKGMDKHQPALCHAHDQAGNQSLDKPELPQVQPFLLAGMQSAIVTKDVVQRPVAARPISLLLTRSTAPPLAIRNCCFRI